MIYKSLLDIENSHSGISLILIDKPAVESDETNRSGVKMSSGPSRRTSTKCLYWIAPRPQYSLAQTAELNKTGEPAFKKKKKTSVRYLTFPFLRLSGRLMVPPILWCINRSSKEKRRVTQNTMISTTVLDVSASGRKAFLPRYLMERRADKSRGWYWHG